MEPQIDGPILVASALILGVLIGSAALWIRQVQRPSSPVDRDVGVAPWNIGWVNFGIFLCALIFTVVMAQNIGVALIFSDEEGLPVELTPSLAIAAILLLQLPMLGVFYGARRFFPGLYAGNLSDVRLPLHRAAAVAAPLFIMLLPLVWIVGFFWSQLLILLEKLEWIEEVRPQELVELLAAGGHPIEMLVLMVLAVVLAPIAEEIIFRGCIYRFLKSKMTLLAAQIASGTIFALLHGNLLSFVPLIAVGVLLARVYEKSGNLWVAIWFHAFFNAFTLTMLFITSLSDALP